jgi:hypothetical protein
MPVNFSIVVEVSDLVDAALTGLVAKIDRARVLVVAQARKRREASDGRVANLVTVAKHTIAAHGRIGKVDTVTAP